MKNDGNIAEFIVIFDKEGYNIACQRQNASGMLTSEMQSIFTSILYKFQ